MQLRVLIVDDSQDDALLLIRRLKKEGYEVVFECVETEAGMKTALEEKTWDLVICDYMMPELSTPKALEIFRESGLDLPFIVSSGIMGEETAVAMMKAGAHDYFRKDNLTRLPQAIERELKEAAGRREHRRNETIQVVTYKIAQAAVSTESLSDLYASIHNILKELLPVENFYIALHDPDNDTITFAYYVDENDYSREMVRKCRRGLTEYVLRNGKPIMLNSEEIARLMEQGEVELVGTPAVDWMGIPLNVEGRIIGVMVTQSYTEEVRLSPNDLELMQFVSSQVAQVIQRKHAQQEVEVQLNRLQALHNIDMAITTTSDLQATLDIALKNIVTQLEIDAANVLLYSPHTLTLEYAASRGFHSNALRETHLRLGEGFAGRAALEMKTVHIPNLAENKSGFQASPLMAEEGFATYFGVPLVAKRQVKGVLEIFHRSPLIPDRKWLNFLDTLATQTAIAVDNATLFEDLQRSNTELALAYDKTLEGWARALELRDMETVGHSRRVTETTLRLARAMGIENRELIHIRRGVLLHDIGKMGIPDAVLLKNGVLDDAELEIMRRHPIYAYEMLLPITFLRPALDIPYRHHEKWDGTGYPHGLGGDEIPFAARMFAIVDVWDALNSDRPYRKAWSKEKIKSHIQEQSGKHFDPNVVKVFLSEFVNGHGPVMD